MRGLPAQLIALFTIALLPLGLISVSQTRQMIEDANRKANLVFLAKTVAAASEERALVQSAIGGTQGLAAAMANLKDDIQCREMMRAFLGANPEYTFAGYAT